MSKVILLSLFCISAAQAKDSVKEYQDRLKDNNIPKSSEDPTTVQNLKNAQISETYKKNTIWLEKKDRDKMYIEYQDVTREQETKKNYHLSNPVSEQDYVNRMRGFAKYFMLHVLRFKIGEGINDAKKGSEEIKTVADIHQTVGEVAQSPVNVEVKDHFKLNTKANVVKKQAELNLGTKFLNASAGTTLGRPFAFDPWAMRSVDPFEEKPEKYRLSIWRNIPLLDLRGQVSYGGSSSLLTGSLSKEIVSNLNCELASSHMTGVSKVEGATAQKSVNIRYNIGF